MADSILRLKVDSQEYDNKLKRAAEGLQRYADGCRKAGGTLEHLDDGVEDFVKELGKMGTTSMSAKGKLNEMTKAFTDLSVEYKHLTDQEKTAPFGKALSQSLDQLKGRIMDAKGELSSISDALNGAKGGGGGLFGGGKLDGMLQVFGGNLMTKAAGVATSFVSEMGTAISQGIELAKQTEGVRMAFERLNQPGLLDNLNEATHGTVTNLELMKAAVKFSNFKLPLEDLGTYLAFAQQKAKDTGESIDYLVTSIVNGLGRQSVQILDNLGISAGEIRKRMAEGGDMVKVVADIIREEMQKAGDYVETASDRAAKANKELTDAMTELGNTFQPITEMGSSMWNDLKVGALNLLNSAVKPLIESFTELGRIQSQYASHGGNERVNRQLNVLRGIHTKQYQRNTYNAQLRNYDTKIGSYEQYLADYKKWQSDKTAVGAYDRMQAFKKQTGLSMYSDVKEQLEVFKKMRAEYVNGAKSIIADNPAPSPATPTVIIPPGGGSSDSGENDVDIDALVAGQWDKAMLKGAGVGVKATEMSGPSEAWEAYVASIKNGSQESADSLQSLIDAFNELNKAEGSSPIEELGDDAKNSAKSFQSASSALSQVGSALNSIEDPTAKIMGTIAMAIANIALAAGKAVGATDTTASGWAWIGAAAAITASMITMISQVHAATGYAQGGVIQGNHYSGDMEIARVNAGETILTRAQSGVIASALQNGGLGNLHLETEIRSDRLIVMLNNTNRVRGRGDNVTSNRY